MIRNQATSDRTARYKACTKRLMMNENQHNVKNYDLFDSNDLSTVQTVIMYDSSDENKYDLGIWSNIYQFMGTRWYLAFFIPFIPSQLTIDGLDYPIGPDHIKAN